MKRLILTHGVVAGAITISSIIIGLLLAKKDGSWEKAGSQWVGYLIMVVALSLIFVAIKRYRDRELGGVISFGTACRLGLGIALVASLIYVIGWEVNLSLTDHAFIDEYTESILAGKEAQGLSGAELEAVAVEMAVLKERYGNPAFRLPMTFLEIFPVGVLVTLIAAGVLRKSEFMPS